MARQLPSRTAFDEEARSALSGEGGVKRAALLVGEIDRYAELANRGGSEWAETLSTRVGELAMASLRAPDLVLREPEGRILIYLDNSTVDEGLRVAERICNAVRQHSFPTADGAATPAPRVSLSIGIAAIPDHGSSIDKVYPAADAACARVSARGQDGAAVAPLAHHEIVHRPLAINRFAGRRAEFDTLVGYLDVAFAGSPQVVAVLGEAGLGASKLLRQLEPEIRLRGGGFICATSSESDPNEPYAVWRGVVQAIHRYPDPPQSDWQELQHLLPSLGGAAPQIRAGSQYRLLEELAGLVHSAATRGPLVIVLDEMQWANATSWEALEHLVSHLEDERLVICLAMRSEREFVDALERRQSLARRALYHEIQLSRLTRDEVKHWLRSAFHQQEVGREFLAFLYRHTEGNPLFIAEVLRALVEDGSLWYSGERWEWSPVSELRLPPGLTALIAKRLSRFSASTLAVLTTAAIIGHEFDVGTVVASGAGSEPVVRLALAEAFDAGLLRPTFERKRGGYGFSHERIAAVLRESISRERAHDLHDRVARALLARDRPPGEIAIHFDRAGSASEAFDAALVAADAAERLYAQASANAYLQLAVRNATTPMQLASARVRLAHLAETGGRFDEVEELCDLAIEWFRGQGDERQAMSLRRMRERARMELGQSPRATLDALVLLEQSANELGFENERVAILTLISSLHARLGDHEKAELIAADCVTMAERLGDLQLLADALIRFGVIVWRDRPARAEEAYRRALQLYERLGDVRGQARCYNNMAVVMQFENRPAEAMRAFAMAISVARAAGMPDLWGASSHNLGVHLQRRGEYDRAREHFGEALALLAKVKNTEYQVMALYNMAHCERESGAWESAAELYAGTTPLARRLGQSDIEIGALAGAGLCYLELGRIEQAATNLVEVTRLMEERTDWFQNREVVEAFAIRMAAREGRWDEAVSRLTMAQSIGEGRDIYSAIWLTAECAETLFPHKADEIRSCIHRYMPQVHKLGYPVMIKRYEMLSSR